MTNDKIMIQLTSPERKYVKVYQDFLDNTFLTAEEELIFIVLKSYVNFKDDSGEIFPGIETICKRAKMSEKRARKSIDSLIKKGIVKKVQRGLTKTNLYTIADYATMWACDNLDDVAEIASNQGVKPMTAADHIAELERMGYIVQVKEKGLASTEPTKITVETSAQSNNPSRFDTTTNPVESQVLERYPLEQIKQFFNYDVMMIDHPDRKKDINTMFDALYNALNWTKPTIRVDGQERPSMVVVSKLMKLEHAELWYAIEKYHEQKERIKNVNAYLLTILYHAKEQSYLDMMNLGHHNGDF